MAHSTTTATSSYHHSHLTRKYRLRNSPPSRLRPALKQASTASPSTSRGVLLPLPPNLRRLPSRLNLFGSVTMPSLESTQVGSKRKRVFSTNENAHAQGRSLRRVKRRRAYKEPDSDQSGMDIDGSEDPPWMPTDGDDEDDGLLNRDHYHLNAAPAHQLHRLRKEELVRLYRHVDASDASTDHLTKHDLVDAIVVARHDDLVPQSSSPHAGPPSSPSSTGAGDDTDGERLRPINKLSSRFVARSFSLGCLAKKTTRFGQVQKAPITRRRISNAASTSGSASRSHSSSTSQSRRSSPTATSSPLVTRLRTRTVSFNCDNGDAKTPVVKSRSRRQVESDQEDDDGITEVAPSPKRLRTRNLSKETYDRRRITPMRKAKDRVGSLKESDREEEDELKDDHEGQEDYDTDRDEDAEEEADEELDELCPSLSPSPTPTRRRTRAQTHRSSPAAYDLRRSHAAPQFSTPRLGRSKHRRIRTQASGTPSDGDDEDTDGEDHGSESDEEVATGDEDTDGAVMEVEVEPRRLRNGKIVGEDEEVCEVATRMEDEQDDVGEEDGEGDVDEGADAASVDLEVDSNTSTTTSDAGGSDASVEEDVEEDVGEEDTEVDMDEDLQDATAKTLVRRRRDHLVKLCESRGIDVEGTKPQLVEALIQWRDNQSNTSPSSGATARPPSTTRPARRSGQRHAHAQTPVLLRMDRVQATDPDTPHPECDPPAQLQSDDGVLLDLEGLGLEDSVIPPSRLTKLDKIGSGGFKDVFVGKLGGKKVAIAEFRGQLTEMDIKELKLLSRFDHPNVVKFLGVSIPENPKETPMIVSELCSNGDLFDYVRNVSPPHLSKVLGLMLDIAHGLKYLHDHKPSVIHRDCKSSNILITSRVSAKIADFGLAKVKQSTRSMVRSLVGTVNWQAPELWHAHPKYNYKVDVFSCAMVFWEILQWHAKEKKFPWEGMNEHAIYEVVGAKQQRPSVTALAKQWCPEIVELMEHMWAHEHKDRPDMTYVVEQLEAMKEAYPPPRTHAKAR